MNLKIIFPLYFRERGPGYTCLSIAEGINNDVFNVSVLGTASDDSVNHEFYHSALNGILKRIAYKFFKTETLNKITEHIFLKKLDKDDIVYLWPGVSTKTIRKIKDIGCIIVSENINTHTAYASKLLAKEYKRLNLPVTHGISEECIKQERSEKELADFIFSPSPDVRKSLIESGVPECKILDSSYGWSSARLKNENFIKRKKKIKFLFVGFVCLRKGIPLLFDAWNESGVDASLVIAGDIEDGYVKELCEHFFKREDVEYLDFVNDIGKIYSECDVFLMPSLEEGSPLVTYEAMSRGLAVLATSMGSAGIVRDRVDGYILDPLNKNDWISALKEMVDNIELRNLFSKNAKEQAQNYTWEKVEKEEVLRF